MKDNTRIQRQRIDQAPGLVERLVSAVQVNRFTVIGWDGNGRHAGFRWLDPIRRRFIQFLDGRGELWLMRPERREVRQQGRVVGKDKTKRWITCCTHQREAWAYNRLSDVPGGKVE